MDSTALVRNAIAGKAQQANGFTEGGIAVLPEMWSRSAGRGRRHKPLAGHATRPTALPRLIARDQIEQDNHAMVEG